jgi:hypothetical protein
MIDYKYSLEPFLPEHSIWIEVLEFLLKTAQFDSVLDEKNNYVGYYE